MSEEVAEGHIVLVATPIGNLGDLSARAIEVLTTADVLCCEDTRRTRALLSASGIKAGSRKLVSFNEHNEGERIAEVLAWVAAGRQVAVVSDAGMPSISDPGARLVAAAIERGARVTVVPGPSSVLAALVLSGLPTERFCVEGFLPRKGSARRSRLDELATERRTAVILEAPSRLAETLADLAASCGDRAVVVARELTKMYEEIWRGDLAQAAAVFAAREVKGEVVVVLGGAPAPVGPSEEAVIDAVRERLEQNQSPRSVAEEVAAELGVSKHVAYELAIKFRDED